MRRVLFSDFWCQIRVPNILIINVLLFTTMDEILQMLNLEHVVTNLMNKNSYRILYVSCHYMTLKSLELRIDKM